MGIATSLILVMGGLSMAAEGSITITETSSTTGTVTWSWSGLGVGDTVTVYAAPKGNATDTTQIDEGTVSTSGTFTADVTLPSGDTWSNTQIEMAESASIAGQLPEVPWAAGLPLLLALPLGYVALRRKPRV
ncbi:MAG: hypothetical protein C7B45_05720 [Sulfobacillus acidophilus]|uniref:Uncharacterized protein n=1 Tax=Sulfobacillus acidophilus TaxID=53633 RepID=A0A2T2WKC9_9FIRM|nr:MAG: hypothetical protein C7B45_05720 [Sulfobacillus acidophilus]